MRQNYNLSSTIVNSFLSVPAVSRHIYQTLKSLANGLNSIQISQERVAQTTGLCRATINRHTQQLENAGLLTITRFPTNSRIPNIYHFDCVTENDTSVCLSDLEMNTTSVMENTHSTTPMKDKQTESSDAELHSPDENPETCVASPLHDDLVRAYLGNPAGQADGSLRFKGIAPDVLSHLVEKFGQLRVQAAIRYTKRQTNLTKPTGFLIRAIQDRIPGLDLSEDEREIRFEMNPGARYTSGKYAAWFEN